MRVKEAAKLLGGSSVVYTIVAACAASVPVNASPSDGGNEDESTAGGSSGGSGSGSRTDGSGGPSIIDAFTDPVPSASADVNQSGTRLKAKYYAGADGSKAFQGWHDSQLNLDCGFTTAADGVARCLPSGAGTGGLWVDATCTQPLAQMAKGCAATYAIVVAPPTCGVPGPVHVHTLGAIFNGTSAYYTGTGTCTAYPAAALTTLGMTNDLYSVGAEMPASSFLQATLQTDP